MLLVERRLPWLPDDTAALTLATFRSLLRAPELKMAFVMPLVMGVVLASMRLTPAPTLAAGVLDGLCGNGSRRGRGLFRSRR